MRFLRKSRRAMIETIGYPSGNYGHDWIVRKYLSFPRFIPLNVRIQHGWYQMLPPDLTDLKTRQPRMLLWSKRTAIEWQNSSETPFEILGAPLVHFRRMMQIEQRSDAEGTVVFPQHSTRSSRSVHEIDVYVDDLRRLPEKFHPITICLHFRDYDELESKFRQRGFERIVTAGESRLPKAGFAKNFYEILSRHRYASSNDLSTSLFYSVEMGIPFFVYGPLPASFRRADNTVVQTEAPIARVVRDLFGVVTDQISTRQRDFVMEEIGDDCAVDPQILRGRIIHDFFLHELRRYPARFFRELRYHMGNA